MQHRLEAFLNFLSFQLNKCLPSHLVSCFHDHLAISKFLPDKREQYFTRDGGMPYADEMISYARLEISLLLLLFVVVTTNKNLAKK